MRTLSTPHAAFRTWCLGPAGCTGGDPGSAAQPAIWVCGIEPGGPQRATAQSLAAALRSGPAHALPPGYADWRSNLAHSFTRRIVKLLAAIAGQPVADYRAFAQAQRPFTRGARGCFRLNLYPIGFADTQPRRWTADFACLTGLARKADYLAWCNAHRLPVLRDWARAHQPRVVLCLGKTWLPQFEAAFAHRGAVGQREAIAGKALAWGRNAEGALIAVLPFLTSASGLQSDAAIQAVGARLRVLLAGRAAWTQGG